MIRPAIVLGVILLLSACAPTGGTTVVLPASQAQISESQSAAARRWMENRGIYSSIRRDSDGMVVFTYGSPAERRMAEDQFLRFAEERMAGNTMVSVRRPDLISDTGHVLSEVFHLSENGEAAFWRPGSTGVRRATYEFRRPTAEERRRGVVGGMVCFTMTPSPYVRPGPRVCAPAYDQISGIHAKRPGDVFGLLTGNTPVLGNDPVWPDGEPLVPASAPHE